MYLYKIVLTTNDYNFKDSKVIQDTIFDYFGALYKNGQILYNYEFIKENGKFCVYCKLLEKTSINKENNNKYVNEFYRSIVEIFDYKVEYVGEDIEKDSICNCKTPSWYMLYTSYLDEESPIICGDCGKSVPLYKLPKIMGQEEYFQELYWQRDYQNIDSLYVSCLSDRFTYKQMTNPNSQLSRNGRKICYEFEKKINIPFYYYIANYKKNLIKCPICNQPWEHCNNTNIVDLRCNKCRLVTDK